jgi:hypothetical protein
MLRIKSSRLARGATAALLMIGLAGPALADHDDQDSYRDRRPYPVYRHGEHCDGDRGHGHNRGDWGRGYDRGDWGRGGYNGGYYDRGGYRDDGHSYGCRPCGRRWRSRSGFYSHLNQSHHVGPHLAPRVVMQVRGGWMFGG